MQDRQQYYAMLYQSVGETWEFVPEAYPFPDDRPGEEHMYHALHQGLHTVMDTLAALVEITEEDTSGTDV